MEHSAAVPLPRPSVELGSPPVEFDALTDWFELVSDQLVLLEEYSLEDVGRAVRTTQEALRRHAETEVPELPSREDPASARHDLRRILVSEHAWFQRSIEQLGWFLAIVERENHGGHRQALGQYGRILAEAVKRHRSDERRFAAEATVLASPDPRGDKR